MTIAQVLYMLGVEPVRSQFGSVEDVRLIPTSELGRPRIDVVIQTQDSSVTSQHRAWR